MLMKDSGLKNLSDRDEQEYKLVRSIVFACRTAYTRPSATKIINAIRAINGKGLRKQAVLAHMRRLVSEENSDGNRLGTFPELTGNLRETDPEPISITDGTCAEPPRNSTGTSAEPFTREENKKLEIKNSSDPTYKPDPVIDPPPAKPVSDDPPEAKTKTTKPRTERKPPDLSVPFVRPRADDPKQPDWVRVLRSEVNALHRLSLADLDSDQRFLLARYHAWRWCNCTVNELHNRKLAGKVASGITALAQDRRYGSLPMSEYVAAGDVAWNQAGRYPMQSAWKIVGALELSGVA